MKDVEFGVLQHISNFLPKNYFLDKKGDVVSIVSRHSARIFGKIEIREESSKVDLTIDQTCKRSQIQASISLADPESFSILEDLFSCLPKHRFVLLKRLVCLILGHKDLSIIEDAELLQKPKPSLASWTSPSNETFSISQQQQEDTLVFCIEGCTKMALKTCDRCGQIFFQHRVHRIVDDS